MRKLFWAVFIVLVFALGGCDAFAPPGNFEYDPDDVTYTDVVYSPDGSSVTIYLEGTVAVPNRQRRALSKELAIAGHDFFEVAFYYQDGANPGGANDVVARASWELMKDAQIRGVKGKDTGSVDYSSEAVWDIYINPNGVIGYEPPDYTIPIIGPVEERIANLSNGHGAAILFVGRKTDKTLLGVGKLDSTTNIDGSAGTLSITPNTKTVTFAVAALECGLSPTAGLNSFWTNYHGNAINQTNTERNEIEMGDYHYYMYELQDKENGGVTSSEYTFRTSTGSFNDYRRGIILAGPGAYEKRQPRYPTPDGQFQYFSVMLDDQTIITSGSNTAPNVGKPFINPVEMTFNTAYTVGGSIFALAFQIPVCPLYLEDAEGGTWYIRASYDSYWLDLDDAGLDGRPRGSGGAIMFRTGKISGFSAYRIRVVAPPNKYLYSYNSNGPLPYPAWAGNPNSNLTDMSPVNRFFNVNGLVVVLEYAHNSEFIRYLNNTELGFEIGMKAIRPRVGNIPGEYLPLTVYGLQTVKVIYIEEGIPHESQFFIIVDNPVREFTGIPLDGNPVNPARPPDTNQGTAVYLPANSDVFPGSGIPMRNFIVVNQAMRDSGNLQDYLSTRMGYAKTICTFVIIIDGGNSQNFEINYTATSDLQPSNPNNTPNLIITLAGRATTTGGIQQLNNSVHLGRGAGTLANGVYRAGSTANSFYFGRWPFNDYLYGVPAAADYHNLGTVARYDYVDTIVIPPDPPGTTRMIHRTYSYSLDAYGPAANGGVDSPPEAGNPTSGGGLSNKYFINDIQGGRFYNVRAFLVGEDPANGILLYNRRWLN
jgi:hypothetical protein